ncbi:MAG: hypothetical protein ACI9BO_002571 [Zhongshania sp.]|jgi:hypothetical protein
MRPPHRADFAHVYAVALENRGLRDQPKVIAQLLGRSLSNKSMTLSGVKNAECAPVLVEEVLSNNAITRDG